jgi:hypothetical protein
MKAPYRTGGKAVAEEGEVMLDGPDGIAISMTPDAAEETGNSLLSAARTARTQLPTADDPDRQ